MICVPDASTIRLIPWATDPTAQVIHDCVHFDGTPVAISPRRVLREVLRKYADRGWRPVIAPGLEFFLVPAELLSDHERCCRTFIFVSFEEEGGQGVN